MANATKAKAQPAQAAPAKVASPSNAVTPALVKAYTATLAAWYVQNTCQLTGQGYGSAGGCVTAAWHTVLQVLGAGGNAQATVAHLLQATAGQLPAVKLNLGKASAAQGAASFWAPGGIRAVAHGYHQTQAGNGLQRVTHKGKATGHPVLLQAVAGPAVQGVLYSPTMHPLWQGCRAVAAGPNSLASNLNAPLGAARGAGKATYGKVA